MSEEEILERADQLTRTPGIEGQDPVERRKQAEEAVRAAERANLMHRNREPVCRARRDRTVGSIVWNDCVRHCAGEVEFLDYPDADFDVTVRLGVDAEKRKVFTAGISIVAREGGPPVTARGVQRMSLGRFTQEAVHRLTVAVEDPSDPVRGIIPRRVEGAERLEEAVSRTIGRRRPRSTKVGNDELELVAHAYMAALRTGEPLRRSVRRALDASPYEVTDSVVAKRIRQARAAELIPRTTSTRPKAPTI